MQRKRIKSLLYFLFFCGIFISMMFVSYVWQSQKELQNQFQQAIYLKEEEQYNKAYAILASLKKAHVSLRFKEKLEEELQSLHSLAENQWEEIREREKAQNLEHIKKSLHNYITAFAFSEVKAKAEESLERVGQYEKKQQLLKKLENEQERMVERQKYLETLFNILQEIDKSYDKVQEYLYSQDALRKYKAMNYLTLSYHMKQTYYENLQIQFRTLKKYGLEENLFTEKEMGEVEKFLQAGISFQGTSIGKIKKAFNTYSSKRQDVFAFLKNKMGQNIEEIQFQKKLQKQMEEELKVLWNKI